MNEIEFRDLIITLINADQFKVSEHALDALIDDELERADVTDSVSTSEILEYYP